jgi:hypothetical protein
VELTTQGSRDKILWKLTKVTKYESILKAKEDAIAFLRGHVAQLTQSISQLALPPSQEEARAKHWYQFWR